MSAANSIIRDPAHCPGVNPVSDNISEAHAEVGPKALTLTGCRVCPDIFSYCLCTRSTSRDFSLLSHSRRSRTFSPTCNMYFLSDNGKEKVLNRFWNYWFFKKFCNTVRDRTEYNLDVISQAQKACIARLPVLAHHRLTAWTAWYQQLFYWNRNTNIQGGEITDCSTKEEELAGWCLLQEVTMNKSLRQLGLWIQNSSLHLHLNPLCQYQKLATGFQTF